MLQLQKTFCPWVIVFVLRALDMREYFMIIRDNFFNSASKLML